MQMMPRAWKTTLNTMLILTAQHVSNLMKNCIEMISFNMQHQRNFDVEYLLRKLQTVQHNKVDAEHKPPTNESCNYRTTFQHP